MKPEILTPGGRLTVIAETEQDLHDVADAAASVLGDGSAEFYKRLTPPITACPRGRPNIWRRLAWNISRLNPDRRRPKQAIGTLDMRVLVSYTGY